MEKGVRWYAEGELGREISVGKGTYVRTYSDDEECGVGRRKLE